jgi:Predicted transcriptional regulators
MGSTMPEPIAAPATARRPDECHAEDWLGFLGHRWNALLLWHLSGGPKRFSELQALLPRISPKVLSERITGMTGRDLVRRAQTNAYPREVTYSLTARGRALHGILSELYDWANSVAQEDAITSAARVHDKAQVATRRSDQQS